MHGDVAYCRKHGHDWIITDHGQGEHIIYAIGDCRRCGMHRIMCALKMEEDE